MKSMSGVAFAVAAAAFGVSAVLFGASVFGAVRTDDVPVLSEAVSQSVRTPEPLEVAGGSELEVSPNPMLASEQSLRGINYPQVSNDEILGAVNHDLFQPDRTPPIQRYLLPGERAAPVRNSGDNRRQREPGLRIVGTAIAGDLAIVLVQLDDSIPFAVLLGEEVDGYMVAAVSEESVTLLGNDSEFTFPVVEPRRGRSSDNNRSRNTRNSNATETAAQALTERVQQMLQGMGRGQMQRGGNPSGFQIPRVIELPAGAQIPTRGGRPGGGGLGGGGGIR